jgi:hypothetical protein
LATEENPININDFGRQSEREKKDIGLFNDLIDKPNREDEFIDLISPRIKNLNQVPQTE